MFTSLAQQFNAGGSFMWAILAVLAVAAAVIIERLVYYFIICRDNSDEVVAGIATAIENGDIEKARAEAGRKKTPLFGLLRTAVDKYADGTGETGIREGIEEASIQEFPKMGNRLNYLSLFANTATLVGLLGTIAGLQVSFSSLANVDAAQKASLLASGIAQAMNTTAFGLIVAVPCMIMYTVLNNKQQQMVKDMDSAVVRLVNYLKNKPAVTN